MRDFSDEDSECCRKKFRDLKFVRYGIASVVDPDPDLLGPSRSLRKELESLLTNEVRLDGLTIALGQVDAAESLSVYGGCSRVPQRVQIY